MRSRGITGLSTDATHERTMSMALACERFGVSCRTLQDWMGRGKVTYAQVAADVQSFVDIFSSELDRQASAPHRPIW